MRKIVIPKLNNNDESCVLREWKVADGETVAQGQIIAILETSKATVDFESEHAGLLKQNATMDEDCDFGATICFLFENEKERDNYFQGKKEVGEIQKTSTATITREAERLIEEYKITAAQIEAIGKSVIKGKDIERLVDSTAESEQTWRQLSRRQLGISKSVSRSHANIPAAFLAIKVECGAALAALRDFTARTETMAGLPELLVKSIAQQSEQYPFFFGGVDGDRFSIVENPGVGVTFDTGNGLFIPVVREAAQKRLSEIVDILIDYRVKAIRDDFTSDDLQGGHISLSVNMEDDVLFVVPIVLDGQSCMISMSSVQTELRLEKDDGPVEKKHITLGVAYDHRVINGYDAAQFAKTLKHQLEQPDAELLA